MKKITALDIIEKIQVEVERRPNSIEKMLHDVKMMQFKIRPLAGDISTIHSLQDTVIESLWRIGTIDSIISKTFFDLDDGERESLLEYLKKEEMQAESDIRDALGVSTQKGSDTGLRVEVFKEYHNKPSVH